MGVRDELILAIDLGTSGPKVALVTVLGEVVCSATHPTKLYLLPGGGAEQDPEDWWAAIVAATGKLRDSPHYDAERIVAVSVTGQWAGTVAIDRDHNALGNAVIWMDTRGAPQTRALCKGWLSIEGYGPSKVASWIRKTGGAPSLSGKDPVGHIHWMRACDPERYERAAMFLEPKDYLNLRLTGEVAASYDSIAMHWVTDNRDINNIHYDDGLLKLTGLPKDKLPPLKAATDMLGTLRESVAAELGLRPQTQVVVGTPDVQSAGVGAGALGAGGAHLYLGTSSWLSTHVKFKKTDLLRNIASLPSALPGQYFVGNSQETAGACLSWLRDGVLFGEDALGGGAAPEDFFARLDELAGAAPAGSDKVIFTPWLIGERCPVADETVRASFLNLSLSTTRAHLARAVLEGVAYNTRWLLGAVESFVGHPLDVIRVVGGGGKSEIWCQIHADVLGRPIAQVRGTLEVNALGAALVASLALGAVTEQEIPDRVEVTRTFEPRGAYRERYDELFAAFLSHYKSAKGLFKRLNPVH